MPSLSCTVAAVLAVLTLSACSKPAPAPPAPAWTRIDLPEAEGALLRDVADCSGRWYVAGGLLGADGTTRPAAWTSTDGRGWQSVPFSPLPSSYYGPHDVISTVACAADRVVMVGALPGGAHGNPRVSTWRRLADGRMAENAATFETYGGDRAVDVGPVAAGPLGFAIAGDRTSGAAAWLSADGQAFTLFEGAPGLAGDATHETMARDAVALPDGRWAIVGGVAKRGSLDELAAAWVSLDGRTWTRADPPATTGFNEIQRAVRDGDDVLAAGVRGTAFGLWRWHADAWAAAGGTFGGDPGGVRSLAVAGGKPVVVGGGLWVAGKAWPTPEAPVAVAGRGGTLLMATGGALWRTAA